VCWAELQYSNLDVIQADMTTIFRLSGPCQFWKTTVSQTWTPLLSRSRTHRKWVADRELGRHARLGGRTSLREH